MTPEEILATEYSVNFDNLRKNRMVHAFFKYGPLRTNYDADLSLIDAVASLQRRLALYEKTGNTEYLVDIANFAMIEYMYPSHPNAHFDPVDDGKSHIVGMGVNQIKDFDR